MKPRLPALASHAFAALLAAVFGYAGGTKLLAPSAFAEEIANYQLLPELAPHVAVVFPVLELLVAALLLVPRTRRAAALVTSGLLAAFLVAVVSVLVRHIDISCGCFGKDSSEVTWLTALRNLGLLALCAYLVFEEREGSAPGAGGGTAGAPGASGDAAGAAAAGRPT